MKEMGGFQGGCQLTESFAMQPGTLQLPGGPGRGVNPVLDAGYVDLMSNIMGKQHINATPERDVMALRTGQLFLRPPTQMRCTRGTIKTGGAPDRAKSDPSELPTCTTGKVDDMLAEEGERLSGSPAGFETVEVVMVTVQPVDIDVRRSSCGLDSAQEALPCRAWPESKIAELEKCASSGVRRPVDDLLCHS